MSHPSFVVGGLTGPSGRQTDRHHVQRGGGGVGERRGGGQKQGPRDRQGGAELADGGRHPSWRDVRGGGLGPDSRDGRRWTTKDSEMERQGGPRRQTRRGSCQVASSTASSPECCGPWEPLRAASQVHPLPPASPPAGLPAARCPLPAARHRAGQGSHRSLELPPSSLSLTSFCSACAKPIWNCLNPNIQPPPPSKPDSSTV